MYIIGRCMGGNQVTWDMCEFCVILLNYVELSPVVPMYIDHNSVLLNCLGSFCQKSSI